MASPYKEAPGNSPIKVRYFEPNNIGGTGLFTVVECYVPVADGAVVLLELVVFGNGEEKHITLEDINGERF